MLKYFPDLLHFNLEVIVDVIHQLQKQVVPHRKQCSLNAYHSFTWYQIWSMKTLITQLFMLIHV